LRLASFSTATMVLKTEKCSFSGLRVYPGHGMRLTKVDSTTFLFLNGKCKKMFNQKKKPAKLAWTAAYRKAHKKVRRANQTMENIFVYSSPSSEVDFARRERRSGAMRLEWASRV
jgi:ribosomal protein L24E